MAGKNNESTMKWKVDVSQLKAGMQDAKRSISLANAEFKKLTAGQKDWANTTTGVEAKIKQLRTTLTGQTTVLSKLQKQYEITAEAMGEDSTEAQKLKIQIENQKASINKTTAELQNYNNKLNDIKTAEQNANTETAKLTSTIASQEAELESLKNAYKEASLKYGENSKEAKSLGNQISVLSSDLKDNKDKMDQTDKSADEFDKTLEELNKDSNDTAKGGITTLKVAMGNLLADGIKSCLSGLKDLAGSVVDIGKKAVENYANYEQLVGGVETLFGDSAEQVQKYADNAYKTAGLSANEYMETVTSFSASLLQGLNGDTKKASKVADMAIKDMSDNANKMGTDMSSIQNAYQGFAKQNYTMLDNLKLGWN